VVPVTNFDWIDVFNVPLHSKANLMGSNQDIEGGHTIGSPVTIQWPKNLVYKASLTFLLKYGGAPSYWKMADIPV
jgi:hypothetical protein